jgi:hypothetical protein
MTLTVTESAIIDLQRQEEAIAKRAMQLGSSDPTIEKITEYDLRLFGTPVRFEIDVTIPIPQLKREINSIRAQLTNCLATLEQSSGTNTRRHMVHSKLCALRAQLHADRDERKRREKRLPPQSS